MKITDLAQAIAPGAEMHDIGLRPGREAARGDDQPRGGPPGASRHRRQVLRPRSPTSRRGATRPPSRRRARARRLPLPSDNNDLWYTRGGHPARSSRRGSERAPLRPPVGRRSRRRGGGARCSAGRLADHRTGRRRVRGGGRAAWPGARAPSAAPPGRRPCTSPTPPPASGAGDEVVTTPMTFVATAIGASSSARRRLRRRRGGHRATSTRRRSAAAVTARTGWSPPSTTPGTRWTPTRCAGRRRRRARCLLEDAAHSVGGSVTGAGPSARSPTSRRSRSSPPRTSPRPRAAPSSPPTPSCARARARVPQHRPGARPRADADHPTRVPGTRRCTRSA